LQILTIFDGNKTEAEKILSLIIIKEAKKEGMMEEERKGE